MSNRTRSTVSPEFRLEAAQLVVNQGRSIRDAAKAMDGFLGASKQSRFSVY
ncbi:MAG: transposase [Zhongshania sp.]|jgi:transposase